MPEPATTLPRSARSVRSVSGGLQSILETPPGAPERRESLPSSRFYRPELDALRFSAFLWVFLSHIPLPAPKFVPFIDMGSFGLSLFFMLSSYLIVTLLLREQERLGTINVKAFAMRRALRILPLYFLGIFLGCVSGLFWPDMRLPWQAIVSMIFISTNLYILKHGWVLGVLGPLWSIAVEEQFYLVIPWIARWGGRKLLTTTALLTLATSEILLFRLGKKGDYMMGVGMLQTSIRDNSDSPRLNFSHPRPTCRSFLSRLWGRRRPLPRRHQFRCCHNLSIRNGSASPARGQPFHPHRVRSCRPPSVGRDWPRVVDPARHRTCPHVRSAPQRTPGCQPDPGRPAGFRPRRSP